MNIYEANTNDNSTNNNYFIDPANIFHKLTITAIARTRVITITIFTITFHSTNIKKKLLRYRDVSNVEDFRLGMQLENIRPNINNWDVSKATNMSGFFSTSSGNKYIEGMDLSGWDVSKVTNCSGFFGGITNWPESKKPNFTNCNPD